MYAYSCFIGVHIAFRYALVIYWLWRSGTKIMNEDRMNGIMDTIRYFPSSIREISTFTNIPSQIVEEYINKLVMDGIAEVSHTRKLKMITITYYRLTNRVQRY
jgi:hypothetical protein